jgi:hypothetical protein
MTVPSFMYSVLRKPHRSVAGERGVGKIYSTDREIVSLGKAKQKINIFFIPHTNKFFIDFKVQSQN